MASEEPVSSLIEEANELLLNDKYEDAVKIFSSAIEKSDSASFSSCYLGRCQAYLKLKRGEEALHDAQHVLDINSTDSRAFLKKGMALHQMKEFEKALSVLEEGYALVQNETESKKKLFTEWIDRCKKDMPKPVVVPEPVVEVRPPAPAGFKHEFYQTESQVVVTVLAKNLTADDVSVTSTEDRLTIDSKHPDTLKLHFDFHLANPILPLQTNVKYLSTKIEIKMKKCEALHWKKLEAEPEAVKAKLEKYTAYPSSHKSGAKNWDKIVAEEVGDDKPDGDPLNALFNQIYSSGSDETRRAMNKSFVESGGTVLSTNWNEIGAKKTDVKPPDGLEWKKWDQ